MDILRRDIIKYFTTGSASLVLRSAVSGIPAAALISMAAPKVFAKTADGDALPPQFLVLSTRGQGDPFNVNCPGSYDTGISTIYNNPDAKMAPVSLSIGGKNHRAAKPWEKIPQWALDRTAFIHHRTYTGIHSQLPLVMELSGSSRGPNGETGFPDHLSSIISHGLAEPDRLNTIQKRPLRFGGNAVKYQGQSVQAVSAPSLKALFDSPAGVDKLLQDLRDKEVDRFAAMLGTNTATSAQRRWLEQQVRSKEELRQLSPEILKQLKDISGNDLRDKMEAALLCFKLNLSSVATISIAFGGDNHFDDGWLNETSQTISGCNDMAYFFNRIKELGMQDQVTLANLNVFGRSLNKKGTGRSHNANHHVMAITGNNITAGVYGGLMQMGRDAGATGIQSATGVSTETGDIAADETLESAARTLAYAVGVPKAVLDTRIRKRTDTGEDKPIGKVISAAIRS